MILNIHEVWHFSQHQTGLFKQYVNQWIQIKQEASGYPAWAETPEQKSDYVNSYYQKEDIFLSDIEANAGRKATAKLMLNSFWGKFGENLDKTQTVGIYNASSLFTYVTDPLIEVTNFRIHDQNTVELLIRQNDQNRLDNGKTNIFIAAFTTCWARLKLYSYLEQLQQQVLYFDTDSVVYLWASGQPSIPLGDFLGEMTDESYHKDYPGDFIEEFVSGGPKNYGYKTDQGRVCCKVRGFSLKSLRGSAQLNYQVLKENLLEEITDPQPKRRDVPVVGPNFFTRDPATKRLKVVPRKKLYGLVFDERVVDRENFRSYPYGYA